MDMLAQQEQDIRLFISEIKGLMPERQSERIAHERKKIACRELEHSDFTYLGVWKRLFFQMRGVHIEELEFIKMCASPSIYIKQCGYLGLLFSERTQHSILMTNTLAKDLKSEDARSVALTFLCNNHNAARNAADVLGQMALPDDTDSSYNGMLIAQSRIHQELFFALSPSNDTALLTKVQIILDREWAGGLSGNDINYIKDRIIGLTNKYLMLKLLQLFIALYRVGKFDAGAKLLEYLKSFIISPTSKAGRYIDIGLSLECCRFLWLSQNFCERAEGFIFRLVTSENSNSRFLAFNFAVLHGLFTDLVCERIIKLGTCNRFYLDTLRLLINKSNYRRIYGQKDEIMHYVLRDVIDAEKAQRVLTGLLTRIAVLADFEFLCRMLYENPVLYTEIRTSGQLVLDQAKPLFKSILPKNNPSYFQLLYDIMPSKVSSPGVIASLAVRHLNILTSLPLDPSKLDLLSSLIDVLCIYGDLEENRKLLLGAFLDPALAKESRLRDSLLEGLLLFNLVLPSKFLHLRDSAFVQYRVDAGKLVVKCDVHVAAIEAVCGTVVLGCLNADVEGSGRTKVFTLLEGADKVLFLIYIQDEEIIKPVCISS